MLLLTNTDAYGKLDGSVCVRKNDLRVFDIDYAKEECSKNQGCIGIEGYNNDPEGYFNLCFGSIYHSTAFDKYKDTSNILYKKLQNYCKYLYNVLLLLK